MMAKTTSCTKLVPCQWQVINQKPVSFLSKTNQEINDKDDFYKDYKLVNFLSETSQGLHDKLDLVTCQKAVAC